MAQKPQKSGKNGGSGGVPGGSRGGPGGSPGEGVVQSWCWRGGKKRGGCRKINFSESGPTVVPSGYAVPLEASIRLYIYYIITYNIISFFICCRFLNLFFVLCAEDSTDMRSMGLKVADRRL